MLMHSIKVLTTACVIRVHASQTSTQNREWALCQLHSRNLINAKQKPHQCQAYWGAAILKTS